MVKVGVHQSHRLNAGLQHCNSSERVILVYPNIRVYVSPQHGAYAKAFSMYTDMLNNRLTGELLWLMSLVWLNTV